MNDNPQSREEEIARGTEDDVEEDPEPVEDSAIKGLANREIIKPECATMEQD